MNIQRRTSSSRDGTLNADTILKSVCRSCHGGCGALLHVRDGMLLKVEGDRESPLNHGRLCPIGTVTTDLVYHPDRLKYPLRRKGKRRSGKWERISWDEALDEISERLLAIREQHGPEAIAIGTGTGRHHIRWVSRFGHALGTPNWCEPGFAQCFHPRVNTSIQTLGDFPVCDFTGDMPPACILYWGHNPAHSGPDGETRFNVREALAHKPKTIVVDPRAQRSPRRPISGCRSGPAPTTRSRLRCSMSSSARSLYDQAFVEKWTHGFDALAEHVKKHTPEWAEPITWVPADKIRAAARLFAQTKPAMLEWGCAIEHTPKCIQTVRAVSMLPALTGNIDVPGGWVFGMHGLGRFPSLIENLDPGGECEAARRRPLQAARRRGRRPTRRPHPDADPGDARGRALSGKGVSCVRQQHADDLCQLVRWSTKRLMKLDFMVCADLFMTPTAELADIVLPAASWPELDQLVGLPTVAANVVLAQQKAVQIGECKSDEEIFVALARRMKLPLCTEPVKDVLDAQLAAGGLDITFDELKQKGFIKLPFKYRKYQDGGFKTPTGKIELYSTRFEQLGYAPLPYYEEPPESPISAPVVAVQYPLVLTTGGRISFFFNSEHRQIGKLRKAQHDPVAEIHPDTAARLGIVNGDVDVDRDAARPDAAEGEAHDRDRSARHPRSARLVVPRTGGPGIRGLELKRQSPDR